MNPRPLFNLDGLDKHTPESPAVATDSHDFGGGNSIVLTALAAGASHNGIKLVIGAGTAESQEFALTLHGNGRTLNLTPATDAGDKATAEIGAGENGTVTIEYQTAGAAGNDLEVAVVVDDDNDASLAVAFASGVLTVTLGTDENGDPDDAKNTATLVAAAITALPAFNATASGTGATAVGALEGTNPFTGGGANVAITTTIADVITAMEDYDSLVTATHDGGDDTTLVAAATIELAGGVSGTPLQQGEACYDDDYIYLAVGNNTVTSSANIKKVALSALA